MNGTFFSLFNLPGRQFNKIALVMLSSLMASGSRRLPSNILSGYVYFGQFLVHDMTRLASGDDKPNFHHNPGSGPVQLRNPTLELDSVYGSGYRKENIPVCNGEMVLGEVVCEDGKYFSDDDLPRAPTTLEPLIGDDRNDENLIIAQLHVQFLKLHNLLCGLVRSEFAKKKDPFTDKDIYYEAKRLLVLLYQEVILHDFLKEVLAEEVWEHVIELGNVVLWKPESVEMARIPVEFSGAAMRFGHSMVLPKYNLNAFNRVELGQLFLQTGSRKFDGNRALKDDFIVDWRFFFDFKNLSSDPRPGRFPRNVGEAINTDVVMHLEDLAKLHGFHFGEIATKNLVRGNELNLPSGQDVARFILNEAVCCDLRNIVGIDQVYIDDFHNKLARLDKISCLKNELPGFDKVTPLWFYLLAEAELMKQGQCLGKIGSVIVAEVIRGLINTSFISCLRSSHNASFKNNQLILNDPKNSRRLKFAELIMAIHPEY